MIIRKLKKEERFPGYLISAYCFHVRKDNIEADRQEVEAQEAETWGAFTQGNTLAARITNHDFEFYIDGSPVCAGGIGGVATLPEYRNSGAIREIFSQLLREAYRNGQVISTLYPFNHAFYRKQGYDTVVYQNRYEMAPILLEAYKTDCEAVMWQQGDEVEPYLALYLEFARQYNFARVRDLKTMAEHLKVESLFKDRRFSYLFRQKGEDVAYLIFSDAKTPDRTLLQVEEAIWKNRQGFEAILAFLGRFDADYMKINLPLPAGIDLLRILRTRKAYDATKNTRFEFMVRVINAEKLLSVIKKPENCDFTLSLQDDLIPENNGVFRVREREVIRLQGEGDMPDIALAAPTFAQMATGAINLDEAMLKPDVQVNANEDMLRAVFTEKKLFINDPF